ncbi:hypothetical protein NDU88_009920 [Pleurodeles waltl]|uniref:Uncharacterized protein n=1 Tax=Pleurodeles waltl TaxID=8319 RepID=A0AAV7Q0R0_PLEWA|nr:hypothetical protein NDU88_009920 [Pleurodeles waltl]
MERGPSTLQGSRAPSVQWGSADPLRHRLQEPVELRREIGTCLPQPLTATGSPGSKGHGESRNSILRSARPR